MSALRSTPLVAVAAAIAFAADDAGALTARQIYEMTSPSVVVVVATNASAPADAGIGSGSIVAADGLILTNFHVVRQGEGGVADTIRVFFKPARLSGSLNKDLQDGVRAVVVATDPGRDLALLSVSPKALKAPPIPITEQLASPGDPSVAIGSPVDGGPWTLTTGAISNRILDLEGKQGKHAYQIETPINPGNSGGALLDADANLLGVTTSAVKIGRGGLPTANIQFAVANDVVLDFIQAALVARQEFREHVDGCAYGVCRVKEENALDRIWARTTRLAGAAGAQRLRLLSRTDPAGPPPPTLDAARVTVARLFGGQGAPVPSSTSGDPAWGQFEKEQFGGLGADADAGRGSDSLTMPPSAAELEELLPSVDAAGADAPAAEPLPEVTNAATAWLSGASVRATRFAAVRWATRPLFSRATSACVGAAASRCVVALASTRPDRSGQGAVAIAAAEVEVEAAPSKPPALRLRLRQAITIDDYVTTQRPIEQEQLSAVGKQLATDRGARAADAREAVVGMLFRGEFREALATVKKAPGLRTLEPPVGKFVRVETDLSAKRYNGARTTLRSIRQPDDLKRLADYWLCKTMRLEGRPIGAEQCFKKGGMTEGIQP